MGAAWRGMFGGMFGDRFERSPRSESSFEDRRTAAAPSTSPAPPLSPGPAIAFAKTLSPIERIDAHRERLFVSAVQLLEEPRAAQQVVTETLDKAILGLKDGHDEAQSGAEPERSLERSLDKMLVSLALVRLKAMPPPLPALGRTGKSASVDGSAASLHDPFAAVEREREREPEITDGEAGAEAQFARTAQVLSTLPIEARVAVTLVVMQGRSLADAAFLLATTEASCRFFLNHGRKLLRRAMQRDLLTGDGEGRAAALLEKFTSGTTTLHDLRRSKKATIRA